MKVLSATNRIIIQRRRKRMTLTLLFSGGNIMDVIAMFLAFIVGVLVQRIYSARSKGFTKLGTSWEWIDNRLYRLLHRIYCELCPRRLYCEKYKKVAKKAT